MINQLKNTCPKIRGQFAPKIGGSFDWILQLDHKIDNNLMLSICIATCLTFAYLLHLIIEKPFMHLRNKIIEQS